MRQNPHVRICGGPGSATTLVYPTYYRWGVHVDIRSRRAGRLVAWSAVGQGTVARDVA